MMSYRSELRLRQMRRQDWIVKPRLRRHHQEFRQIELESFEHRSHNKNYNSLFQFSFKSINLKGKTSETWIPEVTFFFILQSTKSINLSFLQF